MMRWLFVLFLLILPFKGFSHPHIWVDTDLELRIENGQILGISTTWVFDELFSTAFFLEADLDNDKVVETEELAAVVREVFLLAPQDLYPFIHAEFNGIRPTFKFINPVAKIINEQLVYEFEIAFDEPQPLAGTHKIGIYDPEFYVSFDQGLQVTAPHGLECSHDLSPNRSISLYFDSVNPDMFDISCLEAL